MVSGILPEMFILFLQSLHIGYMQIVLNLNYGHCNKSKPYNQED